MTAASDLQICMVVHKANIKDTKFTLLGARQIIEMLKSLVRLRKMGGFHERKILVLNSGTKRPFILGPHIISFYCNCIKLGIKVNRNKSVQNKKTKTNNCSNDP